MDRGSRGRYKASKENCKEKSKERYDKGKPVTKIQRQLYKTQLIRVFPQKT